MKRRTFVESLWFALAASLAGSALFFTLAPWFTETTLIKFVVTVMTSGAVCFLVIRTPRRVGRITTLTVWLLWVILAWLLVGSVLVFTGLHLAIVWLIRSLYCYTSPMAALIDLGLCGLSLVASIGAFNHSGSVFLALWCLFLVQSLVAMIPSSFKRRKNVQIDRCTEADRFNRAYRTAEWALRKISLTL